MNPDAAARRWAHTWERAWPQRDLDAISSLYADSAVCHSPAFRQPFLGLDGVRRYVDADLPPAGGNPTCSLAVPVVSGNRAAVEWWASWSGPDGDHTAAGVTVLRFDSTGQVVDHRDYYDHVGERRPPYEDWE